MSTERKGYLNRKETDFVSYMYTYNIYIYIQKKESVTAVFITSRGQPIAKVIYILIYKIYTHIK